MSMFATTYVDDIREIKEENPFESMMPFIRSRSRSNDTALQPRSRCASMMSRIEPLTLTPPYNGTHQYTRPRASTSSVRGASPAASRQ